MSEDKKKRPVVKIILVVFVILVVICAIGSMGGKTGSETKASSTESSQTEQRQDVQQESEQEPYTVTDEALDESNAYSTIITGTLTNNTDSDKSYIQVQYNLYDADGAQIGTALANTNNLKAGGVWKYEAYGTAEPAKVASWERADVSGF